LPVGFSQCPIIDGPGGNVTGPSLSQDTQRLNTGEHCRDHNQADQYGNYNSLGHGYSPFGLLAWLEQAFQSNSMKALGRMQELARLNFPTTKT
jgi:hypothetical protein